MRLHDHAFSHMTGKGLILLYVSQQKENKENAVVFLNAIVYAVVNKNLYSTNKYIYRTSIILGKLYLTQKRCTVARELERCYRFK